MPIDSPFKLTNEKFSTSQSYMRTGNAESQTDYKETQMNSSPYTPNTAKESSSVNLSKQAPISQPKLGERSLSSGSLKQQSSLLSPRTGSRSVFSLQSQQRYSNDNSLSTTTKLSTLTAGNSGITTNNGNVNKLAPPFITTGDEDKKRLVKQFYNTINDSALNNVPSSNDLSQIFKNSSNLSSINSSPAVERTSKFIDNSNPNNFNINGKINLGGLNYVPIGRQEVSDEDLTNYLLNIDTITDNDLYNKNDGQSSLKPLRYIIASISDTITENTKKSIHVLEQTHSLEELNKLSQYLHRLFSSSKTLLDDLTKNKDFIKSRHRSEINGNIQKLNDLLDNLNHLEIRLNSIKSQINNNKEIMLKDLLEKIEILEFVNNRFTERSKQTSYRRFKQLNIFLAILILLLSMYLGYIWT